MNNLMKHNLSEKRIKESLKKALKRAEMVKKILFKEHAKVYSKKAAEIFQII